MDADEHGCSGSWKEEPLHPTGDASRFSGTFHRSETPPLLEIAKKELAASD
jgi:hypothetical protein